MTTHLDTHLAVLCERRQREQVRAETHLQVLVNRDRRRQQCRADVHAALELEAELMPIARACRRSRAVCNHLALAFPTWWSCWRRQCAIAYRRAV